MKVNNLISEKDSDDAPAEFSFTNVMKLRETVTLKLFPELSDKEKADWLLFKIPDVSIADLGIPSETILNFDSLIKNFIALGLYQAHKCPNFSLQFIPDSQSVEELKYIKDKIIRFAVKYKQFVEDEERRKSEMDKMKQSFYQELITEFGYDLGGFIYKIYLEV